MTNTLTTSLVAPCFALARRELIKFWREKVRVLGFAAAPLLFWLVASAGFSDFTRFYAGSLALSLMFSAVFSNMTLIDDRKDGFLSGMLVSPAPRAAIVLGKTSGAATLAWLQSLLFLLFLPLAGLHPSFFDFLAALLVLILIAVLFTLLGFVCAWRMPSTQAFHGIINVVLLPMWMLSGSLFKLDEAHPIMRQLMRVNPLTYGVSLLDHFLAGNSSIPVTTSLLVLGAWILALYTLAIVMVRRHSHA
jgi:ABC-2 type transport system permease protein